MNHKHNGVRDRAGNAMAWSFARIAVLVLIGCLSISIAYSARLWRRAEHEMATRNLASLQQRLDVVEQLMRELRGLAYTISTDENVRRFAITRPAASDAALPPKIKDLAKTYQNALSCVEGITIYSEVSGYVIDSSSMRRPTAQEDGRWLTALDAVDDQRKRIQVFPSKRKNYYPYYITILCQIRSQSGAIAGAVVLDVNVEALGAAIGDRRKNGERMFLFDQDMCLYYHSIHYLMGELEAAPDYLAFALEGELPRTVKLEAEGGFYVASCMRSEQNGWYVVYMAPSQFYTGYHSGEDAFIRNMLLVAIGMGIALALGLAAYSLWPMRRILRAAQGEEAPPMAARGDVNHILALIQSSHRERVRTRAELEAHMRSLSEAQMQALQSQIQPHFLYNALDAIYWLSIRRFGGENDVSHMTKSLADLLREGVREDYLVSVAEELRYVQTYLGVYAARYPDKFTVSIQATEEAAECEIIRMLLQPLAENAMKHGLKPRRYAGSIRISAQVTAGVLLLAVEDDGAGLTPEAAQRINRALAAETFRSEAHMGLGNVIRRIRLIYGADYGVALEPNPTGGTVARLRLPARKHILSDIPE